MGRAWSAMRQAFPPQPTFTEKNVPDMTGKVCIVTGANTGVGKEVSRILYSKNATVWVCARNAQKGADAITWIKEQHTSSKGSLHFLSLDLADLSTIKQSVSEFLTASTGAGRLDLVVNNAGVMMPPQGSKTPQGYELQLGTNCLGHFLFVKLLTPLLVDTAAKTPGEGSVRVVWVSSSAADVGSPTGGVPMDNLDYKVDKNYMHKYAVSKAGNYYHGTEFARRFQKDGVVSVALNPGNLASELDRHVNDVVVFRMFRNVTTYPPVYGAYTELFAAVSPEISLAMSGCWVVPWGRFDNMRGDLVAGSKSIKEGGTGIAEKFWEWSEDQVKAFE